MLLLLVVTTGCDWALILIIVSHSVLWRARQTFSENEIWSVWFILKWSHKESYWSLNIISTYLTVRWGQPSRDSPPLVLTSIHLNSVWNSKVLLMTQSNNSIIYQGKTNAFLCLNGFVVIRAAECWPIPTWRNHCPGSVMFLVSSPLDHNVLMIIPTRRSHCPGLVTFLYPGR